MTADPIRAITEIITAACAMGTLGFMIFTWATISRTADKVEEVHKQTADLVVNTNSLTTLLVEKTDIAAHAEGVKEGLAAAAAIPPREIKT